MSKPFVRSLLLLLWLLPTLALAQSPPTQEIDIPAGNLVTALDALGHQTGMQFVYDATQLAEVRTRGVHGVFTAQQALSGLLAGSGYVAHQDSSGAMVIVKDRAATQPPAPAAPPDATDNDSNGQPAAKTLQPVVVTGSRIPRSQIEGPSPVITITAQDIQQRGFTNVPDLLQSLTQSLGALTNDQYTDSFTPGARAVDLRGLGPNHTLVLLDGRRIAQYPQAYGGSSDFTDISNIPIALIDRVEILTGSASAVYGSDAMAGVINFILKKKVDGVQVRYRAGITEHGGYGSQMLDLSAGFSKGKFDAMFGLDLSQRHPLWAFQRDFTDSRLDAPLDPADVIASRNFYRSDEDGNYIDPGKATCDSLAYLDQGTMFYASRPRYGADGGPGHYCGTYADVGYGTLKNGRKMATLFASGTYHFNDYTDFYLTVLGGWSHVAGYNTPLQWYNCEPLDGDCADTPFYNTATGQVEEWGRSYFTLEENGNFQAGKIRNIGRTLSLNVGVRGTLGRDSDWNYDAYFSHGQNKVEEKWPALVAAKAQALYLGPSLGVDPDSGYQMYYAPPSRLYTPLTVPQFRSISQDSIDHDKSRAENYALLLTNTNLFQLPAGPVGVAVIGEYGNQYFAQVADPMSLDGSYYGLHNTTAVGSRGHAAVGYEFSVPLFSKLIATTAGRYDRYKYGDHNSGKFTYALGLEYRPFDSLLLRGSLSTGFRAPDLNYLFEGLSGSSSSGTDYYRCRRDEPETYPDNFYYCDFYGDFNGRSHGSTDLKDETSRSFTYGFVYAPSHDFDVSADYYHIKINDEVEFQSSDDILRREADCRLGQTLGGTPVDGNSAYCRQIESQVVRNPADASFQPEQVTSVLVLPINAASDETSGIDLKAHYRLRTQRAGTFDFNFGATYVIMHKTKIAEGQPVEDELTDLYYYLIPRTRANASVTWNYHDFNSTLFVSRLGGIPNYSGTKRLSPTYLANLTLGYDIAPGLKVWLTIDNLLDTKPQRPSDWTSYPYYYRAWFSPVGRAYYVHLDMKFGGKNGM
ncbi:MAG TPA: TonB-dependent receptor [Rhodanobacteraceae bacterium]|nr:TonB-dependent receptor [Rhodanobacteraceae bacterium]